jgi:hypothetical protein
MGALPLRALDLAASQRPGFEYRFEAHRGLLIRFLAVALYLLAGDS